MERQVQRANGLAWLYPMRKKKLMLLLCNPIKPIPSDLRLSWVIGWYLLRSVCTKINFRYERRCQLHDCHKIMSKILLQVTHINLSLKKTIYVSDNWSSPIYKFGPEQLNFCVRYLECATRERWPSECFCKVWLCMPMAINMHQSRQFRQLKFPFLFFFPFGIWCPTSKMISKLNVHTTMQGHTSLMVIILNLNS